MDHLQLLLLTSHSYQRMHTSFDALVEHVKIHGRQTEECPVCKGRFRALNDHIRRDHPDCQYRSRKSPDRVRKDNLHRCGECGKVFKTADAFVVHAKAHRAKALWATLTCSDCGLRFKTDVLCRLHKIHHGNEESTELTRDARECPECHQIFESREGLVEHVSEHGKATEKCALCEERYISLVNHIRRDHQAQNPLKAAVLACCVPGCQNVCESDTPNASTAKVPFFRFVGSADPRYETWMRRLRYNSSWVPHFNERICSDHFLESEIKFRKDSAWLVRTAVPSQLSCMSALCGLTAAEMASGAIGCAVCGLRPSSDPQPKPSDKLTFFRAPSTASGELRKKWVDYCNQQRTDIDWASIGADTPWYVCENHFEWKYRKAAQDVGSVASDSEAVPSLSFSLDINYVGSNLTSPSSHVRANLVMRKGNFCCVPGCETILKKGDSVVGKFFDFLPPADERYEEWLRMVRYNSSWIPKGRARICWDHFPASEIRRGTAGSNPQTRLRVTAFPTQLSCMESLCTFSPAEMMAGKEGCAVCGLRPFVPNRRPKVSEKLEFFRAPSGEIREKWINFCKSQRTDIEWSSISEKTPWFLCENHFDAQNKAEYAAQTATPSLPFSMYVNSRDSESTATARRERAEMQERKMKRKFQPLGCCVPGCRKFAWNDTPSAPVSLHCIRQGMVGREDWVNHIRCSVSWSPKPRDAICSRHFCPEDFVELSADQPAKARRLRANVVPSRLECAEEYRAPINSHPLVGHDNVQTCCVCGCWRPVDEAGLIPSERLSFFPFPDDEILRDSWVTACRQWNPSLTMSKESVICENHFSLEDLTSLLEDGKEARLMPKSGAIPTCERLSVSVRVNTNAPVRTSSNSAGLGYSGYKCCVPGCGIRAQVEGKSEKITFHVFPGLGTSSRFCEWMNRIRCAISWKPDRHSRVCSKHFRPEDFVQETARGKQPRTNLLKKDVVPSVLQCVEKFRSPIGLSTSAETQEVRVCCVCGWWRSTHERFVRAEVLTFFSFPSDDDVRVKWINVCREWNPEFVFSEGLLVCENHFHLDELTWVNVNQLNKEVKLRSDAVPSTRCLRPLSAVDDTNARDDAAQMAAGVPFDDLAGLSPFDLHPDADTADEDESEAGSDFYAERNAMSADESAWDYDAAEDDDSLMKDDNTDVSVTDIANSICAPLRTPMAAENGLPEDEDFTRVGAVHDMPSALPFTIEEAMEITPPSSPPRYALDDALMYCDCCHKFLSTPCWLHAASVCDEPVVPLSVGSLPKMLYLDVCDDSLTGKAVFTKEVIARHTVFGPLIAPVTPGDSEKALYFSITEELRRYYELESDYACNWMKHVRFADSLQSSNLLVFSRGSQVVFVTIKTVAPHEELKVWYSRQYLEMVEALKSTAVEATILKTEDDVDGTCCDDYDEMADAVPGSEEVPGNSSVGAVCMSRLPMESESSLPVTVDDDYRQTDGRSGGRPKTLRSKPKRMSKARTFFTSNICLECNVRFRREDMLRLHQLGHTGYDDQPERECPECSKHFDEFSALLKHVDEHGTPLVECPVCSETCSLSAILVHLHRYHPGFERRGLYLRRLNCDKCGMRFANNFLYRLHQLGHQDQECVDSIKITRKCPECDEMFERLEKLAEHVNVHGKHTKKCPVCNGYYAGMKKHIARNHPQYLPETCCPKCRKECTNESSLLRHLRSHRVRASMDNLTCQECRLQFPKDSLYVIHKTSHDSAAYHVISGAEKCPECDKEFDGMVALLEHVVSHAVAAEKCPECNHWFGRHRLRKHMKNHHPARAHKAVLQQKDSEETPKKIHPKTTPEALVCTDCGLRFLTEDLLHLHKHIHTKDEISVSTRECPECRKLFATADELVEHVAEHASVARKCPVCGRWRTNMSQHLKNQHPGYKKEHKHVPSHRAKAALVARTCSECGLRFKTDILSRLHRMLHGNEESTELIRDTRECPECHQNFEHLEELVAHISEHGRATQQCPVCGDWFAALAEHIRHYHPDYRRLRPVKYGNLTCSECGLRFTSDLSCRLHATSHGKADVAEDIREIRECPQCDEGFKELNELVEHVIGHGKPTEKCPVCGEWYAALQNHTRRDHPDYHYQVEPDNENDRSDEDNANQTYRCPKCSRNLSSKISLATHISKHRVYEAKYGNLTCSECGLRFTNDLLCRLHEVSHGKLEIAEDIRNTRECPQGDGIFQELDQLVEHVAGHGKPTEKCPVCGEWYGALKSHSRREHPDYHYQLLKDDNENDRLDAGLVDSYKCPKCSKEFTSHISLKAHISNHRVNEVKYWNLTCSECGLRFGSEALCDLHRLQHKEKDDSSSLEEDVDGCPQCGESFQQVVELVEHVASHGRRTDKCPVCGQWYAALKEHIRRDHKEHYAEFVAQEKLNCDTPKTKEGSGYRCEKCGKLLPTRTSFDSHMRGHRANELMYDSVTCIECGLRFGSALLCQLHRLQHGSEGCSDEELSNTKSCPECEEEFEELELLVDHVTAHSKATSKCAVCSRWFSDLRHHVRREHPESFEDFVTQLQRSGAKVPAKAVSDGSERKETPQKGYCCPECSRSFENFGSFKRHLQSHGVENPSDIVTCDMCGLRFTNEHLCELHKVSHGLFSKNLENTGKCPECGGNFQQLQALAQHLGTHGVQTEQCSVCNKWFASLRHHAPQCRSHADRHDRSESSDDAGTNTSASTKTGDWKKSFECQECGKEFRLRAGLQAHMKTDHAALKCVVCDKVFGSHTDLQQHMLAHSNRNQLKCGICKKTFQSSRIFAAHVKEHENGKLSEPVAEEPVPNECVVCRKSFADFLELNQHVKKHNVNGGFDCAMCNETFPFYHLLSCHVMEKQHFRPNIGIRCSVCDEELPDESALQLHLFTHHDAELTVKCYLCAERFTCNDDLDVHIAAAHATANGDDSEMEMDEDEEVGRECYQELMAGLSDDSNE
ncbi:uncharacterized protein LOC129585444 [Paramacrobiotus metropolitanus]|uniref:uncharacterized protein LOC129585444 n=1 Tax=Paramacrobiotus metropolitanus TaxID=2943436 RepID=UPI0024465307|nr:uncharacterized protein LOC129585444 [Paramacrobiotus metropolitanus]